MNTQELLAYHKAFSEMSREIMSAKNHDYAGEAGDRPFRNLELCEFLGICSTETGILVRMCDKISRLATFCRAGKLEVKGESVKDACLDNSNYSILLSAYLESKND